MNSFPPIPAPPMLVSHLLGLMFVVHLVFMNYVLAAPFVLTWNLWLGGDDHRPFASWLTGALPVAFTFTITLGVACLLMIQVLFPDRFFTANILLGRVWLLVIPLLIVSFYGVYMVKYLLAKPGTEVWAGLVSLLSGLMIWLVAGIMVSNYFATTMSAQWNELASRLSLILENLTFLPRIAHVVVGAFAVCGMWMAWIAHWKVRRGGDETVAAGFRRQGLLIAAGATGAQLIVGVWFLIWSPAAAWDRLFGGSFPSLVWMSGVASGLALFGALIVATVFPDRRGWQALATALLGWTLVGMTAGRDQIRLLSLDPQLKVSHLPSATQSSAMVVFFLLLLAGLATLAALIYIAWRLPPSTATREPQ